MPTRRPSQNVRLADTASDPEGRALRRGLQVLRAVQQAGTEGVRVVDLCRGCALQRAPVYRILATLIDCGEVRREGRFHYVAQRLLPRAERGAPATGMLARRLAPVLRRISEGCGDASFAVVREGHSAWCVARHVGTHPVQILSVQVGTRQPLGVGAAGLALLAALPKAEADAAVASHGDVLARYGGMTPARLQLLLRATRERGWSVVGNHAAKDALGVGLAVRDARGEPLAAISVAAPIDRMTRQRQQAVVSLIAQALEGFAGA